MVSLPDAAENFKDGELQRFADFGTSYDDP
jgi:hypothetical protein